MQGQNLGKVQNTDSIKGFGKKQGTGMKTKMKTKGIYAWNKGLALVIAVT